MSDPTPKTKFIELNLPLQFMEFVYSFISSTHIRLERAMCQGPEWLHSSSHMVSTQEMRKEDWMKQCDLGYVKSLVMLIPMTKHHQDINLHSVHL